MDNFQNLGLSCDIILAINNLGITSPTKIQKKLIPTILSGIDIYGQAQTGTGKTLAYASSIISNTLKTGKISTIVLAPTRELALQISDDFKKINVKDLKIDAFYGGYSIEKQIPKLRNMDILIGTPGRVLDLLKRKVIRIDSLNYFVLDEADTMLDMGFLEDIEKILAKTNPNKQMLLLSATSTEEVLKLATKYMNYDYKFISDEEITKTNSNISESYYLISDKTRFDAMCRVIDYKSPKKAIIFCQTKTECNLLLSELLKCNYSVNVMHGDILQSERIKILKMFKDGLFNILIATDVVARGIHVDEVDFVINYSIPYNMESYIHRIGRTGRASKKGEAISFVNAMEEKYLKHIMEYTNSNIVKKELPSKEDIVLSKYASILDNVQKVMENKDYDDSIEYIRNFNKDTLFKFAAALLKYTVSKEINSDLNKEIVIKNREKEIKDDNIRLFLTIGKIDKINKSILLEFIEKTVNLKKNEIYNVEVLAKFSFIDIPKEKHDFVINKLNGQVLNNRKIRVEISNLSKK